MATATTSTPGTGNAHDAEYAAFLGRLQSEITALGATPLFTTDTPDLWERYLASFTDPVEKQYHTCHACRRFIQTYGGLVTIGEDGTTEPAIWTKVAVHTAPDNLIDAISALRDAVKLAKVTGVFLRKDPVWGTPVTGEWRHFGAPSPQVYKHPLLLPHQAMAEKRQDYATVARFLASTAPEVLTTAVQLLKTDALYRSEKVLGHAEWLLNLKDASRGAGRGTQAVIWKAVALAPAGYCHPTTSMIGTLIEDIAAGLPYNDVAARFKAKMSPLVYQRPQAAPKAGTIKTAESIVRTLEAGGSLQRRFLRPEEVQAFWTPSNPPIIPPDKMLDGVFGHLRPKGAPRDLPPLTVPGQRMTWVKFLSTVLPSAHKIAVYIGHDRAGYGAFVTAVDPQAPPILQWDREDNRNPVSWYVMAKGAYPAQYGLPPGTWAEVSALTRKPVHWQARPGEFLHHSEAVAFVLPAAAETNQSVGLALFPEILRSEFHGVRSVIEAHSNAGTLEGYDAPHACALFMDRGLRTWDLQVRVVAGAQSQDYVIDRWE